MAYWSTYVHIIFGITKLDNKNIYFISVYKGTVQQDYISKCIVS